MGCLCARFQVVLYALVGRSRPVWSTWKVCGRVGTDAQVHDTIESRKHAEKFGQAGGEACKGVVAINAWVEF